MSTNLFKVTRRAALSLCAVALTVPAFAPASAQAADKPVIALSNAYYGNTWRRQMVDSFEAVAKKAKEQGVIEDYIILNGDGSVNQQMSQMGSLILKGVDAIAIDAASESALNGVIKKACSAGVKVVAFDSVASAPCAYKLNFSFVKYQADLAEYVADRLDGEGNVLVVRGVKGSAPDHDMYKGQMSVLKKYPDLEVVGTVYGQATGSVAQSAVANILPSLPHVDAVLTQGGGDDYGVAKAFEQYGGEYADDMPIIVGGGSSNFIHWWADRREKTGYSTISKNTAPGIGSAAFWLAYEIEQGATPQKTMLMPVATVTNDNLGEYRDMKPGVIVSPEYTHDWVTEHLLDK
ncbi:ABC transporter substrate-binding protein [Arhodomonas aquaeolei]|uniref:ABC transporter substrate-binding protein n=1 Tax=Arhodomonas aquaeolei TaxID=2369 RepID=UPI00037D6A32|nr:ABC transporter substrate-binding protein [Arhodomonas aquaeolei]